MRTGFSRQGCYHESVRTCHLVVFKTEKQTGQTMQKTILLTALALLLAGCVSVHELESWRGASERRVLKHLGRPDSEDVRGSNLPDVGVFRGVEARLKKVAPDYHGPVKHLNWSKPPYDYDVFFLKKRKQWFVIDAVKWRGK
jgi:hypothetical protein